MHRQIGMSPRQSGRGVIDAGRHLHVRSMHANPSRTSPKPLVLPPSCDGAGQTPWRPPALGGKRMAPATRRIRHTPGLRAVGHHHLHSEMQRPADRTITEQLAGSDQAGKKQSSRTRRRRPLVVAASIIRSHSGRVIAVTALTCEPPTKRCHRHRLVQQVRRSGFRTDPGRSVRNSGTHALRGSEVFGRPTGGNGRSVSH